MKRYALAVGGFILISLAYYVTAVFLLAMIAVADCALSDAQIAAGEACKSLGPPIFWSVLAGEVLIFIFIQTAFLRWTLRRRPG